MYLIRIKSFAKNLILGTSGADFLYVLHESEVIKQDVKSKKLYVHGKIWFKELCGIGKKLYTLHMADYTQPVKAD